ncbi:hypothetical protein, partial [Mucilaginibacter sp.]|uniref:hypothetical protein n=1 Tax=Mucilaginibacter sp. TaxID=1882438 RepID=UPI002ED2B256
LFGRWLFLQLSCLIKWQLLKLSFSCCVIVLFVGMTITAPKSLTRYMLQRVINWLQCFDCIKTD